MGDAVKIYLIRHAHAVDSAEGIGADWERFLTPKGRKVSSRVGQKLAELGVVFDGVLTSPGVRAVQTAELVAAAAGFGDAVEVLSALAPGQWSPDDVTRALKGRQQDGGYALVGHNPDMERMAAQLTDTPSSKVVFKKGMACCIKVDGLPFRGQGKLDWVLRPKGLKVLGSFR